MFFASQTFLNLSYSALSSGVELPWRRTMLHEVELSHMIRTRWLLHSSCQCSAASTTVASSRQFELLVGACSCFLNR